MTNQNSAWMKSESVPLFQANELILIRHADPDHKGRLCGRTDIGLTEAGRAELAQLSPLLPSVDRLIVSPAIRCVLTARGLWPGAILTKDESLWEQDFGDWEGMAFSDLPDLGDLTRDELAAAAPPGGESFLAVCARTHGALRDAAQSALNAGPVVVVAHAGVVRAALSMALDVPPAGLSFQIPPLSLTRFTCLPNGRFAIGAVGWRPS